MVPMTAPVLAIFTDCICEGRMATISAAHMGRATSPSESIGWPKAVICLPFTVETVPVPARVMSPVVRATPTAEPGRRTTGAAEGTSEADCVLPPRAEALRPRAANRGAKRSATAGLRPPRVKTG